jgi:WD repeat-containing protein 61
MLLGFVWGLDVAWAVSLCADGKTYASTGASGGITIHSATPSSSSESEDAFGTRLAHIPSGRSKFGLDLEYSPVDSTKIAMSNESGQVRPVLNTGSIIPLIDLHNLWISRSF